jgi:Fe2+ or Zn2+ uptake regulation protein
MATARTIAGILGFISKLRIILITGKVPVMSHEVQGELHESVRRTLSSRDVRYTTGRKKVIESLSAAPGPRSAAELLDETAGVPLSSLYRSLTVLDDAGVLRRQHDADGLARYELAEWLTGHHHHTVCTDCGSVEDIELDQAAEASLDAMLRGLSNSTGWKVTGHSLEVEGVCRSCQS